MFRISRLVLFLFPVLACYSLFSQEDAPAEPEVEPEEDLKFNICVMDFTSADMIGQKRFLDGKNQPIVVPAQCTLNDKDHVSINTTMQGVVRTVDAVDNTRTNQDNRDAQVSDNQFNRAKALSIYNTVTHGQTRPLLLGAQYLTAYLGSHPDVFQCTDLSVVSPVITALTADANFPKDYLLHLAQKTKLTHVIFGTVSDIRTKVKTFTGYDISTKTVIYEMDVIVSMVDLVAQRGVYGKVYTGRYSETYSPSGNVFDNNIYHNLMTAALRQAADDLYKVCKPGPENQVKVTPLPPEEETPAEEPVKTDAPVETEPEKGAPDKGKEEKPVEQLPKPAPETAGPVVVPVTVPTVNSPVVVPTQPVIIIPTPKR